MDSNLPFFFKEVQKLTNLGLNPALFKFGSVTFESQKYITVRDTAECFIIDTTKNFAMEKKPMTADGVLMHRTQNIIALRQGKNGVTMVQVFNLENKQKLKQCEVPEDVRYWRWISDSDLAFVGKTGVYHTNINDQSAPLKVFDQEAKFSTCQVMSYGVDKTMKWCYLIGIYQGANNQICCHMQLYNIDRKQQSMLEGFAALFTDIPVSDQVDYKNSLFIYCEKKQTENTHQLKIMEIGNPAPNTNKLMKITEIQMQPGDFPVLMHDCPKYGVVFIISKFGNLYLYEISTGSLIGGTKLTDQICIVSARNTNTDGMIVINKAGQIFSINVNENNLIPAINNNQAIPDRQTLAFNLAQRFSLPGANEQFVSLFNSKLAAGDYAAAAGVAKNSPGELLRNQDTINRLKTLPQTGQAAPILIYFNALLKSTKLNKIESLELARPVIQQQKMNLIEAWMKEGKLTMSDELGDLIRQANPQMALSIYQQSGSPEKVIQGLIETNQLDKIMPYCQQTGYNPDFIKILRQIMPFNSQACVNLAKMITNRNPGPPRAEAMQVMNVFLEFNKIQDCTAFLVQALEQNRMDEGHLQTKLFEINLVNAPNVAEGIFQMNKFSHYDKEKIAKLCEQVGLFGRALQNYQNMNDIKRVILNVHAIPEEIVMDLFGRLGEDDSLHCMYEMLRVNRQNEQIVAKIAVRYANKLDQKKCLEIFDSFGSNQGQLFFLTHVLPHTQDPDIYFKYIEACSRLGNFREVERVIKETNYYDPVRVKDFLKEAKLADPRPLIYVCDTHNFIDELTRYLYLNKQNKFIEVYLFRVNQNASPKVLGTLLELDCDEVYVQQLLNSIRVCPVPELVEEFENRGKMRLLQPWLEARSDERNQDPALHNALAKIYIDINKNPEKFLAENKYYDSKIIGKYCEDRNPDYAFIAYQRAWGECDQELIEITNRAYLYKSQARYLVERQSEELWAQVLDEANPHRQQVIDQVITYALNETKNSDEVSCTVRSFMAANIQDKLVELLERIVLHNSQFQNEKNLQNLLILTAIKGKLPKLKDYIGKLNNYDGLGLAEVAQSDEHRLYDEALQIYKKFGESVEAIKILLYKMENKVREAAELAEKVNSPEVWTELGKAYLDNNMPKEAIDSFIKARNPSLYMLVISVSHTQEVYEDLVKFLLMARQALKDQVIDNELIFAFAKCGDKHSADLENFIQEPNQADLIKVGDRCFDNRLFQAAKVLYMKYGNNQKLAMAYVMLKEYNNAYEAAKKADVPRVWKAVCYACVRAKEFRFAQLCGLNVIIKPDHLEELNQFYEMFGYTEELIQLLEQGINHERTHNGIYTDLAIMYCKYKPEKLKDFIQPYIKRLQIPKLIKVCEQYKMWREAVSLHIAYEQFDQAIRSMIEHSPTAFNFDIFAEIIVKVSNENLLYDSILFFLEEYPERLVNLLQRAQNKLDLSKTVQVVKNTGYIALIEDFLKSMQGQNIAAVNEALNSLYLERQDYKSLENSIKAYDSFESGELAHQLENHTLIDCRRISALLYRKNQKYKKSIQVSIKDEMFKDAMETVAESKDTQLAEDLMRAINDKNDRELFGAMLYTCYELIKPDVAMEIAWRNNMMEFVMPYMIQFMRDLSSRVDNVHKITESNKKKEEKKEQENRERPIDVAIAESMFAPTFPTQLAITGGPGVPMGGMGMGGMGMMGGMQMGGQLGGQMGGQLGGQMGGMQMNGFPPSQQFNTGFQGF